jgi:hypothetical protein
VAGSEKARTGRGWTPVKPTYLKNITLALLILIACAGAAPSLWVKLPRLDAKALDGRQLVLPESAAGSIALVGFGYKRESQDDLNSWLTPFRQDCASAEAARAYEVPMMGTRIPGLLRGVINAGMRMAIPRESWRWVAPFYGDIDAYTKRLGVSDRSRVQMFLLDGSGVIRWHASGRADSAGLAGLRFEVARLASPQRP